MSTKQLWSMKQAYTISRSNARINIWHGAVRSGKTYASLWAWIRFVASAPPGELLMVGKTERTLKRNILDPLAELVGSHRFKLVAGAGECWLFGRRIYIAGANDERSEGKIRGLTLAGAYGDELTLWPESFFTMLLSRLSVPGAQLFGTTNPDTPGHWLKARYIDRADELNLRVFHFQLDDNPVLDPEYVSALKREYTGLWYKRYIQGLWSIAEGAVYDQFDPDVHVWDDLPENVRLTHYWVGIDYGTTNPFVILLIGLGSDNRLYVVDEWRWDSKVQGRQMTDAQYSMKTAEFLTRSGVTPWRLFYDPSAASFGVQLRHDGISNVWPADNEVIDGIRVISTLLTLDRLRILSRCEGLIQEMQSYSWDAAAQKRGEDAPHKVADHGPDTVRYVINGTGRIWSRWISTVPVDEREYAA